MDTYGFMYDILSYTVIYLNTYRKNNAYCLSNTTYFFHIFHQSDICPDISCCPNIPQHHFHIFFVLMFPTHDINFPIPHFCSFFPIITYNCFSHIFPIVFLAFSHFPSIFPTFSRHFPHLFEGLGGLAPLTPPGADRQAEAAPWRRRAQGAARIGMVSGLVNIQKTMENHHAINGKTHYKYL